MKAQELLGPLQKDPPRNAGSHRMDEIGGVTFYRNKANGNRVDITKSEIADAEKRAHVSVPILETERQILYLGGASAAHADLLSRFAETDESYVIFILGACRL